MMHETHFTKERVYTWNHKKSAAVGDKGANHGKERDWEDRVQLVQSPTNHSYGKNDAATSQFNKESLRDWIWNHALIYLLPNKYPDSVKSNYLEFCKWQSLQYIVGSMGGVLSMQSMFYAVGVGSGSLPLAAALNWVIKDGLGQLGGVLFASRVSTNFDSDPKKWRVRGELALMSSTLLEICTPLFPGLFLPLASIANIGKNISCLASSATRAAINNSFVKMDNLADITGKSGSQAIASSLIGTGLAVIISPLIGASFSAVFPTFLVLSSVQLYALYRAVTLVELDTLNLQRIELVVAHFLSTAIVLKPSEISQKEKFIFPYRSPFPGRLQMNPKLSDMFVDNVQSSTMIQQVQDLRKIFSGENYLIKVNSEKQVVNLLFLHSASTVDVVKGVMHSSLIRRELFGSGSIENNNSQDVVQHTLETTNDQINNLVQGLTGSGWSMTNNFIEERPNRIVFHQ